jgi:hypothetical protein
METHEIACEATVRISASDAAPADWLTRVGDADFPYKSLTGQPLTTDEGKAHLAYNALANGVQDASRLDGWADIPRGVVTMDVTDVEAI